MSDIEEPPSKISKFEISNEFTQGVEEMDETQEEWLSEEILTDEEYHPVAEQERSDSNLGNTSQDDTMLSAIDDSIETESHAFEGDTTKIENIERTLNSLENEVKEAVSDDLDAFLVRKNVPKVLVRTTDKSDDGNDTDDLLRLLGEDEEKSKKKVLVKTKDKLKVLQDASSDDDEYIFEGATVTKLKVAKKALIKKYPATKALPEDLSDDTMDQSLDEAEDLKKIFYLNQKNVTNKNSKLDTLKSNANNRKAFVPGGSAQKYSSKTKKTKLPPKSVLKMMHKPEKKLVQKPPSPEPEEIINEEEFLEEDGFDLDENLGEISDPEEFESSRDKQLLMRPEQMDEEIPSDMESHSDEASLYDELPSSDSDDLEDWFSLDIRTERAGDYIPLLGARAYDLLTEEKKRVTERLVSLRKSLSSITESGRHQVVQIRKATMTLGELDDMMKAT
ncbi:uncharacterized protein ACR2FA_010547 [Aphomia sociella]